MKKCFLLLACFALIATHTFAGNITQQDAQAVAVNFFKVTTGTGSHVPVSATLSYTRTESDGTVDFYAFNMAPAKGFVIVSATDNDEPIIGYSTESYFSTDFSKTGLNDWLNRWAQEIHYVKLNNVIATPKAAPHWTAYRQGVAPASEKASGVGPLCQTLWDQSNPSAYTPALYNTYCPGGTGANQSVTGCVATTIAQIMRYWKYPAVGTSSHSYSDLTTYGYQENYGTLSANFADSTFDWTNMPLQLTNSSTAAQIKAVARLMSCAGISVEMDYSPNGSGAIVLQSQAGGTTAACAQYSYVHYFGYQTIIQGIVLTGTGVSGGISQTAFIDSIEYDLNRGRLVQIQGTDPTNGGHTWVCDGYNTSDQLHMNWGWSGQLDGYFAVTSMNPGSGSSQLTFSQNIGALIHIVPPVTTTISELASANTTSICAGSSTQLSATTHSSATYSWSPTTGLSSSTIANPVASPTATTTYTVTADSAGITATSSVTITVHTKPTGTVSTSTNPACYGASTGSITVSASGGTATYHYAWSNGQTAATASSLAQGTYTVTITDANSCTASVSQTLTQPSSALSANTTNVTNANCGQANGSISISASGGTSSYTYHWNTGATTATISSLAASTYTVTVTDAHSCTTTISASITNSGSLTLTTAGTNELCYGATSGTASATVTGSSGTVTYNWSNGSTTSSIQSLPAGTYTVTITDGTGCSAISSKTVTQPTQVAGNVSTTPSGCGNAATGSASISVSGGTGSYTYSWSTGATAASVSNLATGNYTVTVRDANSCSATYSAVVASSTPISLVASSNNAACNGDKSGSVQVSASSGTSPFNYVWSTGATTSSVTGLGAGTYTVTVADVNQCSSTTSVSVSQPSAIQVATSEANATGANSNGSATVTSVSGGTPPYTYVWSNGQTSETISELGAGNYGLTITDANGCYQTASILVNVSTGLNNINGDITFTISPNPAGSIVLVKIDELNGATTLNIRNILGQTMVSEQLTNRTIQVDLATFANGVYLVELRQGDKTAVKQLVIAK